MAASHFIRSCECLTALNCLLVVEFTGYSSCKIMLRSQLVDLGTKLKNYNLQPVCVRLVWRKPNLFLFVVRAERIVRIHVGHKLCRVDVFGFTRHRFPHLELGG